MLFEYLDPIACLQKALFFSFAWFPLFVLGMIENTLQLGRCKESVN